MWGKARPKEYMFYYSVYIKPKKAKLNLDITSQDSRYLWSGRGSDQKGPSMWGTWVAQSVECQTPDFSSGHDSRLWD